MNSEGEWPLVAGRMPKPPGLDFYPNGLEAREIPETFHSLSRPTGRWGVGRATIDLQALKFFERRRASLRIVCIEKRRANS